MTCVFFSVPCGHFHSCKNIFNCFYLPVDYDNTIIHLMIHRYEHDMFNAIIDWHI